MIVAAKHGFKILSARCLSTSAPRLKLINLTVDDKSGIATLELNRPPVQSLNTALLQDVSSALTDLGKNKSRGLILTSVWVNVKQYSKMVMSIVDCYCFWFFVFQDVAHSFLRWIRYFGNVQTRSWKSESVLDNIAGCMAKIVWFSVPNGSSYQCKILLDFVIIAFIQFVNSTVRQCNSVAEILLTK